MSFDDALMTEWRGGIVDSGAKWQWDEFDGQWDVRWWYTWHESPRYRHVDAEEPYRKKEHIVVSLWLHIMSFWYEMK